MRHCRFVFVGRRLVSEGWCAECPPPQELMMADGFGAATIGCGSTLLNAVEHPAPSRQARPSRTQTHQHAAGTHKDFGRDFDQPQSPSRRLSAAKFATCRRSRGVRIRRGSRTRARFRIALGQLVSEQDQQVQGRHLHLRQRGQPALGRAGRHSRAPGRSPKGGASGRAWRAGRG